MSWGAVAIAGSSIVGSVISSRSASKAASAASDASDAQIAFAQEQYDDWQATYGSIQSNLAGYYGSLTSDYFETQGLQAVQQEYATARDSINQSLAQRGITDSGVAASIERDTNISEAEAKATVREQAPVQAAEAQLGFLQVGMGSNPTSSVSNALSQATSYAQQTSSAAQQAAGSAVGTSVSTIGKLLGDYLGKSTATGTSTSNN